MNIGNVNWLAVILCLVISMVSGSIWYGPKTFYPVWRKGIGKSETGDPSAGIPMNLVWALTIFSSFIQALAFALLISYIGSFTPGGSTWLSGALIGFLVWLGFIAPTYMVNKLFAGHGFKVWAIEVGNHLINFVLFGVILGAWH